MLQAIKNLRFSKRALTLLFTLALVPVSVHSGSPHLITIAVVDGGFTEADAAQYGIRLCKNGIRNYSTVKGLHRDHALNVAALIAREAKDANYCIINYQIFSEKGFDLKAYYSALINIILTNSAAIVNLSIQGSSPDDIERSLLNQLLDKEVSIVASAGNQGLYLDKISCKVYPACNDQRITVVGNFSSSSNYGPVVDLIENGQDATAGGSTMSGTSQAAAIFTGKAVLKADQILRRPK